MSEEARTAPDWERVEADYRAGLLSLREIAAKDGHVTEGAIRKKAKKLGWSRDLAAKIQAKAEELVRKEAVRTEYAVVGERVLVDANAQAIATVRLGHRKDISTARALCLALLSELEAVTSERLTVELLRELLDKLDHPGEDDKAADKARDALYKAISLPSRAGSLKALADSLKTLVTIEREAWGLKTDGGADSPKAPIGPRESLTDDELLAIASSGSGAGTVDPEARTG